jgi:hypothetical protein
MSAIFEAYNLPVESLVHFYHRLNKTITYPDGMATTLGIIYWGREEHLAEIEKAIPRLINLGLVRFNDVLQATRTPGRSKKVSAQAAIPAGILRILTHDLELWLPEKVLLEQFGWFQAHPACKDGLAQIGLVDQWSVISAGQTPLQREGIARQARLELDLVAEIVKLCDFYRTGKNLQYIRSKIYYDMGMDTWPKWAQATPDEVISRFTSYIQANDSEAQRLIPWPKEVRNGIEWAKMHLEIYTVEW